MSCVTFHNVSGTETLNSLLDYSFSIRKNRNLITAKRKSEQAVADILIHVKELTNNFSKLITELKHFHWFDGISEDYLKRINSIIVTGADAAKGARAESKYLKKAFKNQKKNLEVIEKFEDVLDHFEDTIQDLEVIFFHLPEDREYNELTKKLALLE